MSYRKFPLFMIALALALFVGSPLMADDAKKNDDNAKAKGNTHMGRVVSVTGDTLTMKGKDGKEHEHKLSADARITCDGKECKLEDLKPGSKIRVTTQADDKTIVTKVEALDKNKDFGGSKRSESKPE